MSEKPKYWSFKKAVQYTRSLKLESRYDWEIYCMADGLKPAELPSKPEEKYKAHWEGWRHWLGTTKKVEFLPFEEARDFVRSLNLKGTDEWKLYFNWNVADFGLKPANIPSSPHIYYKDKGWKGYGDWLGTNKEGNKNKQFRSFESAKEFAQQLKLTSSAQWVDYCNGKFSELPPRPKDIPSNIARKYHEHPDWQGLDEFLNTKQHRLIKRSHTFLPIDEAKKIVHTYNFKNLKEWNLFIKDRLPNQKPLPANVPKNPLLVYKNSGWKGFGDWLGNNNISPIKMEFRPYDEARKFARTLGFTSSSEWIDYCAGRMPHLPQKPDDIPYSVARKYAKQGWVDYKDFLMPDEKRSTFSKFLSYDEAKKFVHKLQLKNVEEWKRYLKNEFPHLPAKPKEIPGNPAGFYKGKGWVGIGDWLNSGAFPYSVLDYRPFKEAREFVRSLGLVNSLEWIAYCKGKIPNLPPKPNDIPTNVVKQYTGKGWKGFKDFLATKKNRETLKNSLSFENAKVEAQKLRLRSEEEWNDFVGAKLKASHGVKPKNIPANPQVIYLRFGWSGFEDWLGIKNK